MLLSVSRSRGGRASAVLVAVVVALTAFVGAPAEGAGRVTPGDFTGYGFDQCRTQDQETMDRWLNTSPYWAVGVYIAGDSRYCGDAVQTELTPTWVATQLQNGWKILPITVGPQASCAVRYKDKVRINPDPTDGYAAARRQGRLEARETVRRAQALGIAPRSTLWYDIEHVTPTDIGPRCRDSALAFLSAWSKALHALSYVSGVYSSASSWIRILDDARRSGLAYVMPDRIWIGEWMDASRYRRPPTARPPSLLSTHFSDDGWLPGGRMRQYRGGHDETYGGKTINIDTNYLDLGRGTRPGRAPSFCRGTRVDFPRYYSVARGARTPQVTALQCLLRRKGLYDGALSGFYNAGTERGVRRFQETRGLRATGRMFRSTWTVMLSEGRVPVLKIGSGGNHVRRVQRALNAAVHAELAVDGIFGPGTTAAVRAYQSEVGISRTGVVAGGTWARLLTGRL